jgi:hypothetical protein
VCAVADYSAVYAAAGELFGALDGEPCHGVARRHDATIGASVGDTVARGCVPTLEGDGALRADLDAHPAGGESGGEALSCLAYLGRALAYGLAGL